MSDNIEEYEIKIDGFNAEFFIDEVGSSGQSISGQFVVKCFLGPLDTINVDKEYRRLLGDISPHLASMDASNAAFVLSQLKYRIIKAPPGWKNDVYDGSHLDLSTLIKINNIAVEAQSRFTKKAKERLEGLQKKITQQIESGEIKPEETFVSE